MVNQAADQHLAGLVGVDAVILVEGNSDRFALEALAERRGRRLADEAIAIVPMGGATNIGHFLQHLGPQGLDVRVAGLCDVGEERYFRRGLERAGMGSDLTRADMEALGFFVCVDDLEDELIRSVGAGLVERAIEEQGELRSLHILQQQPAQRGRSPEQQLHRFMGSQSGRKSRYARLLVHALDADRVPHALDRVLAHI